jgi:hypothetical protein
MDRQLITIYNRRRVDRRHVLYLQSLKMAGFEPKIIYDIGACITEWTDAAKLVWPNARCILFEAYDKLEPILQNSGY